MANIQKLSTHLVDYAERLSDMADAAEGKRQRGGIKARWFVLPATGAALYALVRSDSVKKPTKQVMGEAKTRAAELPSDLLGRVREATGSEASQNGGSQSRSASSSRKRQSSSKRTAKSRS